MHCPQGYKAQKYLSGCQLNKNLTNYRLSKNIICVQKLATFNGNSPPPPYSVAELFEGIECDVHTTDMWSLGLVLYFMWTGCLPFQANNYEVMKQQTSAESPLKNSSCHQRFVT